MSFRLTVRGHKTMKDLPLYINDPDAIVYAALYNDFDAVRFLLDKGIDINTHDERGRTALIAAAEEDFAGMLKLLIERGADLNARDEDGDTALDVARFHRCTSSETILIQNNAPGRSAPSSKQASDDAIYDDFQSANAIKNLVIMIEENKKKTPNNGADPIR